MVLPGEELVEHDNRPRLSKQLKTLESGRNRGPVWGIHRSNQTLCKILDPAGPGAQVYVRQPVAAAFGRGHAQQRRDPYPHGAWNSMARPSALSARTS
jgi:hypothetical protein